MTTFLSNAGDISLLLLSLCLVGRVVCKFHIYRLNLKKSKPESTPEHNSESDNTESDNSDNS